jgi:predicted ATPase
VLEFRAEKQAFRLVDERIENEQPNAGLTEPFFYYRYQRGHHPLISVAGQERKRGLTRESVEPDLSILAQRRDPDTYPELSYLAGAYEKVRIYREWAFGRNAVFREPQKADLRNDRLEEDFSNLGLFLNRLRQKPKAKREILAALGDLYEGLSDFDVSIEGGTVQVFFTEGDFTIPATRLSDGTLRYLCLMAILCDPEPPPLICIEEPELGLHPDILPKVADLLVAAATRTQLIVTTHSDILVDAMTERPEAILICEKHEGQTATKRLDGERLRAWLECYKSGGPRLGESWIRGELGGTRW